MQDRIEAALKNAFDIRYLEIINTSYLHKNHTHGGGDNTHWELIIQSDSFQNISLIISHKMIYKALGDIMKEIHALSINILR